MAMSSARAPVAAARGAVRHRGAARQSRLFERSSTESKTAEPSGPAVCGRSGDYLRSTELMRLGRRRHARRCHALDDLVSLCPRRVARSVGPRGQIGEVVDARCRQRVALRHHAASEIRKPELIATIRETVTLQSVPDQIRGAWSVGARAKIALHGCALLRRHFGFVLTKVIRAI